MQVLAYDDSMSRPLSPRDHSCPITFALDLFGDKWSLLILRDIVFKGKRNYREFLASPEKISTNILANRLKQLESDGLVDKGRDPHNQSKFVYTLTDKGRDLLPLLLEVVRWSATHNPQPDADDSIVRGAPARLLQRLDEDRDALIAEILASIDQVDKLAKT